jgi:hypothetical protein
MKTDTPRTDALVGGRDEIDRCLPTVALLARQLERELNAARRLAEKYRNLSCDSQDEADETLLPWETTNQNEL